jgi:hypothetical protein
MPLNPDSSAHVSRNVDAPAPARLVIGFLVAPMAVPPVLFAVLAGAWVRGMSIAQADTVGQLVDRSTTLLVIATMIGYLVTLLVAAPTVSWLINRNLATRVRVIGLGACLGAAPFVAYFLYVALASGWLTDAPVAGLRQTVHRLTPDAPLAAFWLLAGTASGVSPAATLALIALVAADAAGSRRRPRARNGRQWTG